ncbi:MAG TPA: hypothetical protein VGB20_02050, partial [bacterium]
MASRTRGAVLRAVAGTEGACESPNVGPGQRWASVNPAHGVSPLSEGLQKAGGRLCLRALAAAVLTAMLGPAQASAGQLLFEDVPVDITTGSNEDLVITPGEGGVTQIGDIPDLNRDIADSNDDLFITGNLETEGDGLFENVLTVNGATFLNRAVTLGTSTTDDLTVGGRFVSSLVPRTAAAHNLGSATLGWGTVFTGIVESAPGTDVTIRPAGGAGLDLELVGSLVIDGMAAPAVSDAGTGRIYFDSTTNTFRVSEDGSGYVDLLAGIGGGEANTASNVNVGGVGVFDAKVGVDLQFRGINAGSPAITVTNDAANNEIDIGLGTVMLDDLNDVAIAAAADGHLLLYDGVTDNRYENAAMSGDVAITGAGVTAIQPNAVELGTDTTGDYVASIANGAGITGGGAGSEGAALTLAIDTTANLTLSGDWDFGAGLLQLPNAITLPITCEVGDVYVDSDAVSGQQLYVCESPGDTWVLQGGTGDITDVGDCSGGACFTAAGTGNTLYFEGATADGFENILTSDDPTVASATFTLPDLASASTVYLAVDATSVTDLDGTGLGISAGALRFAPAEIGTATWLDNASRTWTFDAGGATDPQITFADGVINVSAGTLQQGGTPVVLETRTLTAGAGLTGGGDLSANRTFDVVAGDASITVNANDLALNLKTTAQDTASATTTNAAGLEIIAGGTAAQNGLTLLQGCGDGQILKWEEDTDTWDCAADFGGTGDITAVGSMTTGDVFADGTADGQWLGLGAAAGRIEFDAGTPDEVNILDAFVGIGTPNPLLALEVLDNSATDDAVVDLFSLTKDTTGTAAAGIGAGMIFQVVNDLGTTAERASIDAVLTDTVSGTEDADLVVSLAQAGAVTELMRLASAGSVQIGANGTDGSLVLFNEAGVTDYTVSFTTDAAQAADIAYVLPPTDGGVDQFLQTDGSGMLTWATPTGAGDVTDVGDCTGSACFTAAGTGTTLYFEGATPDGSDIALTSADPVGNFTITLPAETGVVLTSATSAGGDLTGTYPNPDIAADSVALMADTTGDYVASISNGAGITGGDGGSEAAALSLAIDTTSSLVMTGDWDFGGGVFQAPNAITLPASCETGDIFIDTDAATGQQFYACESPGDAWVLQSGGGEANTASNVNAGGVGVFEQKAGVDLQFRGVNAASSAITVALDAGNSEIDIGLGTVALDDLSDVAVSGPANAQLLVYDFADSRFENVNLTGDVLITAAGVATIQAGAVDISTDTNLTAASPITLAGDQVGFDTTASVATTGAWDFGAGTIEVQNGLVAGLPAAGTAGRVFMVTDGADDDDCSAGGGTTVNLCLDTGAAWVAAGDGAGIGEANTASNEGAGGVGVFIQKTGVNLEFRTINTGSAKVIVSDDAGNNEIDVDLGSVALSDLSDVTVSGPADAQLLLFDNGTGEFQNVNMTGDVLIAANGATTIQSGAVALGSDVSGVLPIANGGTNTAGPLTAGSVLFSSGSAVAQDNTNFFWDDASDRLGIGTNAPGTPIEARTVPASVNTVVDVATFTRETTGVAAAGIGAGLTFDIESDTGFSGERSSLDAVLTDATAGSEAADFVLSLAKLGTVSEMARLTSTGSFQVGANGTDGSLVLFNEAGVTDYTVTFGTDATQAADIAYVLPPDDGGADQFLRTDGSGTLTWDTPAGAGDVTDVGDCTGSACFTAAGTG